MGTIVEVLGGSRRVMLETVEHGERISAIVADRRSAGRRLARAGVNPYAELPGGRGQ
jgi:hypothetical protein